MSFANVDEKLIHKCAESAGSLVVVIHLDRITKDRWWMTISTGITETDIQVEFCPFCGIYLGVLTEFK